MSRPICVPAEAVPVFGPAIIEPVFHLLLPPTDYTHTLAYLMPADVEHSAVQALWHSRYQCDTTTWCSLNTGTNHGQPQ